MGALVSHPGICLRQASSWYRTEPIGFTNQDWFINGVVHVETTLGPQALLAELLRIEGFFGRERKERWGPRKLDLDLLFYGDIIVHTPSLILPHPYIPERRFVLEPLAEIVPSKVHPVLKKTVAELLLKLNESNVRQKLERMGGGFAC